MIEWFWQSSRKRRKQFKKMSKSIWQSVPNKALKIAKPVVHYGFVPLIIYIAMRQEPELT
jgi:uncharacterized membrane protein